MPASAAGSIVSACFHDNPDLHVCKYNYSRAAGNGEKYAHPESWAKYSAPFIICGNHMYEVNVIRADL